VQLAFPVSSLKLGLRSSPVVEIMEDAILKVSPRKVELEDISHNTLYTARLAIQNVSGKSERIRIRYPETKWFTVKYNASNAVAPGLEIVAEVQFCVQEGNSEHEFFDSIEIKCTGFTIKVPLVARFPRPRVVIDNNGFIDLGTVVSGHSVSRSVNLKNLGSVPGRFQIGGDFGENITVTPIEGVVAPKSEESRMLERIKITLRSGAPEVFRKHLTFDVEGQAPQILDIAARVEEQSFELVLPGQAGKVGPIFDFGVTYFGKRHDQELVLVNRGPHASQFSICFHPSVGFNLYKDPSHALDVMAVGGDDDKEEDGLPAGYQNTMNVPCPPLKVSPCHGVVEPNGEMKVCISFEPTNPPQPKGFKSRGDLDMFSEVNLELDIMICGTDNNQNIPLKVKGRALKPKLEFSQTKLVFGSCPTFDRRDVAITVTNKGKELYVEFSFKKVAFFGARPNQGKLLPGQSTNIIISFLPTQMGNFRSVMELVVERGVQSYPLTLYGICSESGSQRKIVGGPKSTLADFQPEIKYVDEEEVKREQKEKKKFVRVPPWEKWAPGLSMEDMLKTGEQLANNNNDEQHQHSMSLSDSVDQNEEVDFGGFKSFDANMTYSADDLKRRQQHRDQYADFLKKASEARRTQKDSSYEARLQREREKMRKARKKAIKSKKDGKIVNEPDNISSDDAYESDSSFVDANVGLEPQGGLRSPRLKVPKSSEALWMENSASAEGVHGAGYAGTIQRRRNLKKFDDSKLLKRKFKPQPTSQTEILDCKAVVQASDLALVQIQPKVLDFGTVSVNSKTSKCLAISNDLQNHILVEINFDDVEELASSHPKSQVVPPGALAGFDMTFCSTNKPSADEATRFKKSIGYMINGIHKFRYAVLAEIVPILVELEKPEIYLRFDDDDLSHETSMKLKLYNRANASAHIAWEKPSKRIPAVFSIEPEDLIIEPLQNKDITVRFTPRAKAPTKAVLLAHVRGGHDIQLACKGEFTASECSLDCRVLDFGRVPVGFEQTRQVMFHNPSCQAAVFSVKSCPDCITVTPTQARIPPGTRIPLTITFLSSTPVKLGINDSSLWLTLRGCIEVPLPLSGESVLPEIEIDTEASDFGGVTIGTNEIRSLSLQNKSDVSALLLLDLGEHLDFEAALTALFDAENKEIDLKDYHDVENLLRPATAPASKSNGVGLLDENMDEEEMYSQVSDDRGIEDEECTFFELRVPPLQKLIISLVFIPKEEKVHDFYLPLKLQGASDFLNHHIFAEGLRPKLVLSSGFLDFETKVVPRGRGGKTAPAFKDISITNLHENKLKWEIDATSIPEGRAPDGSSQKIFTVKPCSGQLEPGDKCLVKFGFTPLEDMQYSVSLPIFLDGDRDKQYVCFEIFGTGMFPRLRFDTREVILPCVPLGVKTRGRFTVINEGYENLELKYKLPPESQAIPLKITFPHGKTVGNRRSEVPVDLFFVSEQPMSFTAKIEFVDRDDERFGIRVIGTTENCLLTVFPFVAALQDRFTFMSKGEQSRTVQFSLRGPEQFADGGRRESTMSLLGSLATKSGSEERIGAWDDEAFVADAQMIVETASSSSSSMNALVRFLNVTVLEVPIVDFPRDLITANGKQLYELIRALSGKSVPGKMSQVQQQREISAKDNTASYHDQLREKIEQYSALLKFLKSRGALMHDVRAEHFLSKEEFVRTRAKQELEAIGLEASSSCGMTVILSAGNGGTGPAASVFSMSHSQSHAQTLQKRHILEREFASISSTAWSIALFQVLKLFVLNAITLKQYKSSCGVESKELKYLQESLTERSNIYSAPEQILLHWLNHHFEKGKLVFLRSGCGGIPASDALSPGAKNSFRQNSPIINFDGDLNNGVILCTLIASHVPSLTSPGRPLSGTVLEPTEASQCMSNLTAVMSSIRELGLEYTKNPEEMMASVANARDNLLLVVYLFQNLPMYVAKADVNFSCALGSRLTKSIELNNSSSAPVRYSVEIVGSQDFQAAENKLTIKPRDSASLNVKFSSRFSRSVEAYLMLKPDRGTSLRGEKSLGRGGAPLVFHLVSSIISRTSIRTIKCATRTYDALPIEIEVANPFSSDARFTISLVQMRMEDKTTGDGNSPQRDRRASIASTMKKSKKQQLDRKGHGSAANTRLQAEENLPDAYTIRHTKLTLKAGGNGKFMITFLPFLPGEYKCQVIFFDEVVGEFLYEIIGEAAKPVPLAKIAMSAESRKIATKQIPLPFRNTQLEKAMLVRSKEVSEGSSQNQGKEKFRGLSYKDPASVELEIEVVSPFFSGQERVLLAENDEGSHMNAISLNFRPQEAGVYPCLIILRGATQIRVIEVEATAKNPTLHSELDFRAPSRQSIQQGIPIVNCTKDAWAITALFEGSSCFSGPRQLQVMPSSEPFEYVLEFRPSWIGNYTGELTLDNITTSEKMVYVLNGVGEDPLAEDHIIIECKAREKVVQEFVVKNDFGSVSESLTTFFVESDLPHVGGEPSIIVPKNSSNKYGLTAHPLLGGTYMGSITFSLGNGKPYIWYTLEIRAGGPDPEDRLRISAFVRKAVAVEISLVNPLAEVVEFEVSLQGHGLIGEPVFELAPRATAFYELVYSPLLAGEQVGSITFVNDKIGEMWYELSLEAFEAPPVELDPFECPVGDTVRKTICLENPTTEAAEIRVDISNDRNFRTIPRVPSIEPFSSVEVEVEYLPSSVGMQETGNIRFHNARLGTWELNVSGRGLSPGTMPTLKASACIGDSKSGSFVFRNPFPDELSVNVSLDASKGEEFHLLLTKSNHIISPFGNLMIPYSFAPMNMTEKNTSVRIAALVNNMTWIFPIEGTVEAPPHFKTFEIRTRAREAARITVEAPLIGLPPITTPEPFGYEVEAPEHCRELVDCTLTVVPVATRITKQDEVLNFQLEFCPLKPFTTSVDLVVSKRGSGRWRFQLRLISEEAKVDDVISIQAALQQTSSVSFQLKNQFEGPASFRAYLTVESALQFAVHPTSGVLAGRDEDEGTTFIVSFTPTEYGKVVKAKLIVETKEMQWSYALRGSHPTHATKRKLR